MGQMELDRRMAMAAMLGAGSAVGATLGSALTASAQVNAPVRAMQGAAKGITIAKVETFDVVIPLVKGMLSPGGRGGAAAAAGTAAPTTRRANVASITTNTGVIGYSFIGATADVVKQATPVLLGKDLFAVEEYLKQGLINWGGIEEAMWDAIGKVCGQPVYKLLGGAHIETMPVYCTYVWPGNADQTQVTPKQQGAQAVLVKAAGINALKIRIFRPDYRVDVEAVQEILAAGGPGFRCMVDRTATQPATGVWSYAQGLEAAKALEAAGCYWLEEPFARDDYDGPAKLRKDVPKLIITGGEGYQGLAPYITCVRHDTYGVLQPELSRVAGILTARKVAAIAEAAGYGFAPHASSGPTWAGRAQCSAAGGALIQEIGVLTPPYVPNDYFNDFLPIMHGQQPYVFKDGNVTMPKYPGLGLNLDDAAIKKFRTEAQAGGGRGGAAGGAAGGGRGGAPGAPAGGAAPAGGGRRGGGAPAAAQP